MLYETDEHVRKNQKPMPRPRPDIIKIIVTREFAVIPCPRSLFRLHAEREREKKGEGERKKTPFLRSRIYICRYLYLSERSLITAATAI